MQEKNKEKSFKETLFIVGPTAVGKTDFSYQLSALSKKAIINCDIGQFYTPLSIGTAKPDLGASIIPHYLFNILDTPKDFNVESYRETCGSLLQEFKETSVLPVFVGGSLFYAQSLFFKQPLRLDIPESDRLKKEEYSWNLLHSIDSLRASKIHVNDTYRINRALDIWYTTGRVPSENTMSFDPLSKESIIFFLTRDRDDLYERINKRTESMLQSGWIEEVELLSPEWKHFIKEKKNNRICRNNRIFV